MKNMTALLSIIILSLTAKATDQNKTLFDWANVNRPVLNYDHTALIIIDAQEEYRTGKLKLNGVKSALNELTKVLKLFRTAKIPVIHIVHEGRAGGLFDPTGAGFKIMSEASPMENEIIIRKKLPNSFAGTQLKETLDKAKIDSIVVVGFMTHNCVESTSRAGLDLGYKVFVVPTATATRALPTHDRKNVIDASKVQETSLAALFDRHAFPIDVVEIEKSLGEFELVKAADSKSSLKP